MVNTIQHPLRTVKDLLKDNWDNTNTPISSDPRFSTGWYRSSVQQAQVTVTTMIPTPATATETGATGIDPTGAGPTQRVNGTVDVNCWAAMGLFPGIDELLLSYQMAEEVRRIVINNHVNLTDLDFGYPDPPSDRVDADKTPSVFVHLVQVNFGYLKQP